MGTDPRSTAAVVVSLLCLVGAASDATRVRRCYDALEEALAARDGQAAAALLSRASHREWADLRRVALHGARAEVEALPVGTRLVVLALRQQAPVFLLRDGTPPELVSHAVRSGLADREVLELVELRDVAVRDQRASGPLFAAGLPAGFRVAFTREDGVWKLDLPGSLEAAGHVVSETARATGATETEVIVRLLSALGGGPVGDRLWQPLVRDRGPSDAKRGG